MLEGLLSKKMFVGREERPFALARLSFDLYVIGQEWLDLCLFQILLYYSHPGEYSGVMQPSGSWRTKGSLAHGWTFILENFFFCRLIVSVFMHTHFPDN